VTTLASVLALVGCLHACNRSDPPRAATADARMTTSPPSAPRPADPRPTPATAGPQEAASALLRALDARNPGAVRAAFHAPTPKDAALADALAPLLVSARRLQQATAQRFGPDAARRLGASVARLDPYPTYAQSPWNVQGDRATFDRDSRTMVRDGGHWKLLIPEATQSEDAARQTAEAWQREARVLSRTAAEVEAGRYASDEELVGVFTRRVAQPPAGAG
jgi:hypothetical protein